MEELKTWEVKIGEKGYTVVVEIFNFWFKIEINGIHVTEGYFPPLTGKFGFLSGSTGIAGK